MGHVFTKRSCQHPLWSGAVQDDGRSLFRNGTRALLGRRPNRANFGRHGPISARFCRTCGTNLRPFPSHERSRNSDRPLLRIAGFRATPFEGPSEVRLPNCPQGIPQRLHIGRAPVADLARLREVRAGQQQQRRVAVAEPVGFRRHAARDHALPELFREGAHGGPTMSSPRDGLARAGEAGDGTLETWSPPHRPLDRRCEMMPRLLEDSSLERWWTHCHMPADQRSPNLMSIRFGPPFANKCHA